MDITATEVVVHAPGRPARRRQFHAETSDALRRKVSRWAARQDDDVRVAYAEDYVRALPPE